MLPISLNPGIDLRRTFFLSEMVQRWGKLPLALLAGADVRRFRYGFVGTEDWGMYPAIPPGSLLVIDDTKRKIVEWRLAQPERTADLFSGASRRILLPMVQRERRHDQPDSGPIV